MYLWLILSKNLVVGFTLAKPTDQINNFNIDQKIKILKTLKEL
jgi:hypothetical protein